MDSTFRHALVIAIITSIAALPKAHGQFFGNRPSPVYTGLAYLSDIDSYLQLDTSRGETRYDELQRPKVNLFNGVNLPNGGVGKFFNAGYTVIPSVFIPIGPGVTTERDTFWQWGLNGGFNYTRWESNGRFQLNQPGGKDFGVGDFHSYTGEFGVSFHSFRPFGDGLAFIWSAGVNGILGGMSGTTPVGRYNPQLTQVTQQGDPNPSAFLGGFCARASTGIALRNGWELVVEGGYTGFGSDVITGQQRYSDSFTAGVNVRIPLISRLPLIQRFFRTPTQDRSNLLLMVTPRIIMDRE